MVKCFYLFFWSPLKQEQFSSNSLIHDQIMWLSISTVVKWHLMLLNGKNKINNKNNTQQPSKNKNIILNVILNTETKLNVSKTLFGKLKGQLPFI